MTASVQGHIAISVRRGVNIDRSSNDTNMTCQVTSCIAYEDHYKWGECPLGGAAHTVISTSSLGLLLCFTDSTCRMTITISHIHVYPLPQKLKLNINHALQHKTHNKFNANAVR